MLYQQMRPVGFYWIRFGTLWIPGSYQGNATDGYYWYIMGFEGPIPDSRIGQVGVPVLPPGYDLEIDLQIQLVRREIDKKHDRVTRFLVVGTILAVTSILYGILHFVTYHT